jgi:hypothetical protein
MSDTAERANRLASGGLDKVRRQWEHLRIAKERAENERRQRQELADLYDEQVGDPPSGGQTGDSPSAGGRYWDFYRAALLYTPAISTL